MTQVPSGSANTVQVRVQVVDMQSFTLDLVVPTYLPARDVTQRIARDAGLASHWPDGRRRLYWLRARGRLVGDDENLANLHVVPGELVYLLPEPPAGSSVAELPPEYPANRGYTGRGIPALFISILSIMVWSIGWGIALSQDRSALVTILPGLGLGLLTTSVSRHMWGGRGNQPRVVATGLILFLFIGTLAFLGPLILARIPLGQIFSESVPGFVAGLIGVLLGWLAWWGPVEPLPPVEEIQKAEEASRTVATVPCAICGLAVNPEVRQECPHLCGRYFHVGCYKARMAVYRGDPNVCGVCNQALRRQA